MLELRLLGDSDIPLVERWLNKEHVKRSIDDWMTEIRERNGQYRGGVLLSCGLKLLDAESSRYILKKG